MGHSWWCCAVVAVWKLCVVVLCDSVMRSGCGDVVRGWWWLCGARVTCDANKLHSTISSIKGCRCHMANQEWKTSIALCNIGSWSLWSDQLEVQSNRSRQFIHFFILFFDFQLIATLEFLSLYFMDRILHVIEYLLDKIIEKIFKLLAPNYVNFNNVLKHQLTLERTR